MSLNCNEINLILDELDIEGSFIQEIIQPGYDTLALYTYRQGNAKTVFICIAQNECRIHETRKKIPKNDKPLRFMELLRSKIRGTKILSCKQIGLERILKLELTRTVQEEQHKKNEQINSIQLPGMAEAFGKAGLFSGNKIEDSVTEHVENYILYVKLWNNAANVILTDENSVILDSMFRRPERNEVTGAVFNEPEIDESKYAQSAQKFPVRNWQETGALRGNLEDGNAPLEGVAEDSAAGWRQGEASPSHPLTFNAFVENWYSEHAATLSRDALLEKTEKWYTVTKSKRENALNNLIEKQKSFENAGQLKHQGDLILSYGYLITGDSNFLECEDYDTGKTVRLMINPKLSVQENAGEYYKKYKKAVSGAEDLNHDIEIARRQLEKLEKLYSEILNEKNPVRIEQLLRRDTMPKQQQKKNHPGLDYTVNGWYILVGRDASENDELLRHHVRGDDLWLHVRDFPGGYVFVKAQRNKTVPLDILLDAANLAVYYSKARNAGKVDLYYTHVKYLRRAKNGPKGLVLPSQEKNLCITPDKDRLSRLDAIRKEAEL